MLKVKVSNMTSNNGNDIPNQFIIKTNEGEYFQSYQTVIAFKDYKNNKLYLDTNYDYSRTTSKYRNMFLNDTTKNIERKIKEGIYILTNLNK